MIEREIGRGARSTVYLAWHEGLQIPVAVKVMRKQGADEEEHFAERFLREARIAAQLAHPNIVRVYDCGATDDSYYLVMEYIEGESCKDRMARGAGFDWQSAVRIIRQVADGLSHAARKGIIHRDLKPDNIMIDRDGNARIADLGLAKETGASRRSATTDGDVLGTPYYMSPEQVRQPGDVDLRSDIYSLGATLYHMTTAEVPFEAPTPFEIMTMHLNESLAPPHERRHDLPEALSDVIMRAMAKEPQNRYQNYADLIRDLDSLLAGAKTSDAFMVPVEETLDRAAVEEPAVGVAQAGTAPRASVAVQETPPRPQPAVRGEAVPREAPVAQEAAPAPEVVAPARPRPIDLRQVPATRADMQAKVAGLSALIAYTAFALCLYFAVSRWAGPSAGAAAILVLAGLSIGCALVLVLRPVPSEVAGGPQAMEDQISAALSWVCERLDLPTPRLHVTHRRDLESHAFSLFGRKAALYIPGGWLERARLTDGEMRAFLAQNVGSVCNGNSSILTLIGAPVSLLSAARRVLRHLAGATGARAPLVRLRVAQAVALAGMLVICVALAGSVRLSVVAGLTVVAFCVLLLLVSSFERHSVHASDAFASHVTGDAEGTRSLAVVAALTGLEGYRLLWESVGPAVAGRQLPDPPGPEERAEVVASVAAHYATAAYVPGTMDMAMKLLSGLPFAGERLNRLAGLPEGRSWVASAVGLARRVYAGLLGAASAPRLNVADLSGTLPYAAMGVVGGVLSVAAMVFLSARRGVEYGEFLAVVSALGIALGLAVGYQAGREGAKPGRVGWVVAGSAASFGIVATLGFCLLGWAGVQALALQFPVTFGLTLLLTAGAGAAAIQWLRWVRPRPPRMAREKGSLTGHAAAGQTRAGGLMGAPGGRPEEPPAGS